MADEAPQQQRTPGQASPLATHVVVDVLDGTRHHGSGLFSPPNPRRGHRHRSPSPTHDQLASLGDIERIHHDVCPARGGVLLAGHFDRQSVARGRQARCSEDDRRRPRSVAPAPAALQSTMPTVSPFRNRCPQGQADPRAARPAGRRAPLKFTAFAGVESLKITHARSAPGAGSTAMQRNALRASSSRSGG